MALEVGCNGKKYHCFIGGRSLPFSLASWRKFLHPRRHIDLPFSIDVADTLFVLSFTRSYFDTALAQPS
jgi:hypothetical protein